MKDTMYYVNEIKKAQRVESDYAVSKLLSVSRQTLSKYKLGRSTLDSDASIKAGELLNISPLEILANVKASKTKDPAYMKKWQELASLMHSTAASTAIVGILSLSLLSVLPSNIDASTVSAKSEDNGVTNIGYYVK